MASHLLCHRIHETGIFIYMKTIKINQMDGKYTIHRWNGFPGGNYKLDQISFLNPRQLVTAFWGRWNCAKTPFGAHHDDWAEKKVCQFFPQDP